MEAMVISSKLAVPSVKSGLGFGWGYALCDSLSAAVPISRRF